MIKDNLSLKLHSLTVFRKLLEEKVFEYLLAFLDEKEKGYNKKALDYYSLFVSEIYKSGYESFSSYLYELVCSDENVYIKSLLKLSEETEALAERAEMELEFLREISSLTKTDLLKGFEYPELAADFKTESIDLSKLYKDRIANINKYGYGMFSKYKMFYISEENKIIPVQNPDRTKLSELIDYKREQKIILDNTLALLSGKPASNILLTGDAGTGKSSTVKAIVNELYSEGLRILEVRKEQLREIPKILDELSDNPLKFIIFIDDLSFQKDDDNFSALKAILEGSVSSKDQNVVIYATSNRRHLVKESFADREGDDIHRNDTMQEIISLSERFGIKITFSRPDKKTYLDIVAHLAKMNGIEADKERLELEAERFVLSKGARSARAAKQFIDCVLAGNIKL